MKKSITTNQPAKAGEVRADVQSLYVAPARKMAADHKPCDHTYGRTNKRAIGINHEPGLFY